MKRLTLSLIVLAVLLAASAARAQDIYLTTRTPLVSQAQLRDALPAFQRATGDFRYWWGGEPTRLLLAPAPGAWTISIAEGGFFDGGGFHFLGPDGPYARVFANNAPWQLVLSHELFEMLADPFINRTAQGDRLYLVEICDPVEAQRYAYSRRSASGRRVMISDFVGPDWYSGGRYFDFRHYLKRAHELLSGGYASYWGGFDWESIFAP